MMSKTFPTTQMLCLFLLAAPLSTTLPAHVQAPFLEYVYPFAFQLPVAFICSCPNL